MAFGSKLTFGGITQAIFKRLRKKAAQNGIPVHAQVGMAVKDGVTIQWRYDSGAQVLEVGCVHSPFWIDPAHVNRRLTEEIETALEMRKAA